MFFCLLLILFSSAFSFLPGSFHNYCRRALPGSPGARRARAVVEHTRKPGGLPRPERRGHLRAGTPAQPGASGVVRSLNGRVATPHFGCLFRYGTRASYPQTCCVRWRPFRGQSLSHRGGVWGEHAGQSLCSILWNPLFRYALVVLIFLSRNLCYLCGGTFLLPLSRARTIAL